MRINCVNKTITKAVFPVTGMGTRFLPATKASPKEMLPIVDKPLTQYAVEEAVASSITELIFVTGRNKRAIEDHFDKAYELETELEYRNKKALLESVQGILPPTVSCQYIRQAEALGLGHAVLCARPAVGNAPFAVILADDLVDSEPGAITSTSRQVRRYSAWKTYRAHRRARTVLSRRWQTRGGSAGVQHRRETAPGRGAFHPGDDRPLHPHPAHL